MIFINAITKNVPLWDFDVIKESPIDKIKWKGDTSHVNYTNIKTINEAADPPPLTSDLIWISNSHTGDYHDNINCKMFMKFMTTKVIPLATRNYPSMQMVLVMDNATYHHVRGIPPLMSISKKITVNLMNKHGIDYVLLPLTDEKISLLPEQYNRTINNGHLQLILTNNTYRKENQIKRSQNSIIRRTKGCHFG